MNRLAPLALLSLVAATASSNPAPARSSAHAHVVHHLNGALDVLSQRDLFSLTDGQRENRATAIETLMRYRDAGKFPKNRDFANQYVPYFVDPVTGALCAVGHLMMETGHAALVARLAATDNHVRVRDLAGDAEVEAWLETHGISLAEASRIQPAYGGEPPLNEPTARPRMSAAATSNVAVASGVFSALTLFPPSPRFAMASRVLGAAASVTAIFAGADLARLGQDRATATSALVTGGIGTGVAFASWYFTRNAPTRSASRWRVNPATDGRQFFVSVHRR